MYQIAICDDEKIFTDKLAHMIKQYSNAHHHVIDLHLFQQAADFIQSSLESYDIVFLDVRFGEISGIEVAKALRAKNENAILIFVSAFIEYAIMGYSVHASAYLLKSDLDGTFESCMDEIFPQIGSKEISVRVPYEHVNVDIPCKSIIYMESYKRQIQIHTSLPRYPSILYYAKLSDMIETLAPHGFLRIHKSYLINLSRCRRIQNRLTYIVNSLVQYSLSILIWILFISLSFAVFNSSPYSHLNCPLTPDELAASWIKAKHILIWNLLLILLLQIFFAHSNCALYCEMGIIAAAISFFVSKFKEVKSS